MHTDLHPYNVKYLTDPTQAELRALTLAHTPLVIEAACGNLSKVSRNKARMAKYTYVIAHESDKGSFSHQVMDPARAAELIARQRAYIEDKGQLIEIRGTMGLGPRAVGVQWLYTLEGANIAGMQQVLAFPVADGAAFAPALRVVYTPDCFLEDMPGRQAILVDLDSFTTYIMGADYFGESKKGALRMLNELVYREGGLVLHAGAKAVTVRGKVVSMTIKGLSGTGKTTTTFSKQGEVTRPIQDDMVVLWPDGELSITENGCFAKTFGLTAESEPVIYRGTLSPAAWTENVYLDENGDYDFSKGVMSPAEVARWADVLVATGAPAENVAKYVDGSVAYADVVDERGVLADGWEFVKWAENGRSIIPLADIEDAADLHAIPPVRSMGILNRDEGRDAATPGIVRFTSPEQAAGYFMLGETTKTSAAGKDVGKTRSPFTQPFFPRTHGLQAVRFSELAATLPGGDMWLMNTGYVGGDARSVQVGVGLKVKIRHSSAMLEALLKEEIAWTTDPDFGYEVVDVDHPDNASLLEKVPVEILSPARLFAAAGRGDDYQAWVSRMKEERRAFLEKFAVEADIIAATVGA